MMRGKVSEGL